MKIITSADAMQTLAKALGRQGRRIGLVPTMGYLHEGHMSLVRKAREGCDEVVVSSFVNPTQFGPNEDFEKYPRDTNRDDELCRTAGVDLVFRPSVRSMYDPDHSVFVDELSLSKGLCGRTRPGHFRGVATVVAKLFNIVLPQLAVFGQKDAQQVRVIEQMVRDLNFPVEVVVAPIVRESDGLAMSSRNTYLSVDERTRACSLYRALCLARGLVAGGELGAAALRDRIRACIEEGAAPVEIDYIDVVDYRTLAPVARIESVTLAAVAVRIGRTRLIDNIILSPVSSGTGETK